MTDPTPARRYDFRIVPIGLIDPPEVAMRRAMDPDKLDELRASIKADGLKQPIGLRPTGDRFRVSYGHRRLVAAGMAGETELPAFILADDDDVEESSKIAENWHREDTNPAEEAIYFEYQLTHKYAGDIERMCRALGVKESRVNNRLDLLRGFEDVFEALQARQINLGVARELNRIKTPAFRTLVLRDAIAEGATAGTVQARRLNIERMEMATAAGANGDAAAVPASTETPIGSVDRCLLCDSTQDPHEMVYVRAHRSCLAVAERAKTA